VVQQLARLRRDALFSALLWGAFGLYVALVGGLLRYQADEDVPCLLTEGGMTAVGEPTWRWAPPIGWECDYSAHGAGSTAPGWALTRLVASVPLAAGAIVASRYAADRFPEERGGEEVAV
jgi:hypothetical protein